MKRVIYSVGLFLVVLFLSFRIFFKLSGDGDERAYTHPGNGYRQGKAGGVCPV